MVMYKDIRRIILLGGMCNIFRFHSPFKLPKQLEGQGSMSCSSKMSRRFVALLINVRTLKGLPRPQKMTDTAKALRILNALCGTKDSLSHTFSVPFLGKLINNVREIKGKSIWMLRRIQRAQLGFRFSGRPANGRFIYVLKDTCILLKKHQCRYFQYVRILNFS